MVANNYSMPGSSSKIGSLPMFFSRAQEPDFNNMTVEDFLRYFNCRNFDEYFDRTKILNYIEKKAELFEREIMGKVFCPRCKSSKTLKIRKNGLPTRFYRCSDCKKKFRAKGFINSRFSYGICTEVIANFAQGKTPREIFQLLVTNKTNHILDYGTQEEIPDEKTLYDILEKSAKNFDGFHRLMILLMGGIPCKTLYCDDAFARKRRKRGIYAISKKNAKLKRFYYAILTMDADRRFTICLHVAPSRDKAAFLVAFSKTKERLKGLPEVIRGDKLKAMVEAAESLFPKERVKHDFRKLKPWEKRDLMRIERRIKDFRKTVRKRQKSGSLKVLSNRAALSVIESDYLNPMEETLNGRSPAQAVGIPYPFFSHDWRKFMIWVDWIFNHMPEILKSGLKQLPGCSLKPCNDSADQLFKERIKLKKRNSNKN
jgi:transposase-like protein